MQHAMQSSNKTNSAPHSSHGELGTALRCRHCGFVIDGTVTHYNGSTYHETCGEYVSYWKLGDTPLIKGDD